MKRNLTAKEHEAMMKNLEREMGAQEAKLKGLEKGMGEHIKREMISRRGFIKAMAGLGALATTLTLPMGTPTLKEAVKLPWAWGSAVKPVGLRKVEEPPYEVVTPPLERVNADAKVAGRREFLGQVAPDKRDDYLTGAVRYQSDYDHIHNDDPGFTLKDYGLYNMGWTINSIVGGYSRNLNFGTGYCWGAMGSKKNYDAKLEVSPAEASRIIKNAGFSFTADLVGISNLDKRWFYSNYGGKPVVFEDVEEPTITDDTITVPEKCKYVVDIGQYMEIDYLQYAPGALAEGAAVSITYSKMAFVANTIAEYIRMMGYTAIPTGNDLALTIPNCIDGGLGQLGRLGLMMTPEYGPSVRPCKVFTDMPLEPDSPIDFNVTPFCQVCKKCARECPAACIPFDERTDGYTPNDVGAPFVQSDGKAFYGRGTLKWYTHHEKDNKWWSEIGSGCAMCIAVCPYTKKPGFWSHDMAKWLIENIPSLDSLFVWTDDFLGYGRTLLNSEVARKRAVDYWKKKPPRATYKPFRW